MKGLDETMVNIIKWNWSFICYVCTQTPVCRYRSILLHRSLLSTTKWNILNVSWSELKHFNLSRFTHTHLKTDILSLMPVFLVGAIKTVIVKYFLTEHILRIKLLMSTSGKNVCNKFFKEYLTVWLWCRHLQCPSTCLCVRLVFPLSPFPLKHACCGIWFLMEAQHFCLTAW